jgi:hypothetical protein
VKRFWVALVLLALIGVSFTAATISVSPAHAAACFSSFTNKTTADGLGDIVVNGVYAVGSNVYAATNGGLSISTDGGATFTNKTTTNGLGNNVVHGVYAAGSTVYAATDGGLSISADGGATFANKTTADGLGNNVVRGVYAAGSTVYAATNGGLSNSADCPSSATASSASSETPGIFLAVKPALVGTSVTGAPIYCGAEGIQPNSAYTLSVQSVTSSALTRTVLDRGTVNSQGNLDERVWLGALNPGSYKIVMTGIHASGSQLVLTNYITVDATGSIGSVSAESQQPFLN